MDEERIDQTSGKHRHTFMRSNKPIVNQINQGVGRFQKWHLYACAVQSCGSGVIATIMAEAVFRCRWRPVPNDVHRHRLLPQHFPP